ncbi:MAG: hypothetical protein K2L34_05545 [Muribaculaceae bacterium]|nr:hypothetical protein [Muribaculaceae bacterium]
MQNINTHIEDIPLSWPLIKNVSDEEKIRLITLLSQSLSQKSRRSDKAVTRQFLDKYYGAWKGAATAEEVIDAIRSDRTYREPISFD